MQRKFIPKWYQPIKVRHRQVGCAAFKGSPYETEIVQYAIDAYGFLLAGQGEGKTFSFADLAGQIGQSYDCSEPRTAEVIRVLKALHQRNPYEPQGKLPYGFRDLNANHWCNQWVDSYNQITEIINRSGDGIIGSLSEREREFYLSQRHRQYQQFAELAIKSA